MLQAVCGPRQTDHTAPMISCMPTDSSPISAGSSLHQLSTFFPAEGFEPGHRISPSITEHHFATPPNLRSLLFSVGKAGTKRVHNPLLDSNPELGFGTHSCTQPEQKAVPVHVPNCAANLTRPKR